MIRYGYGFLTALFPSSVLFTNSVISQRKNNLRKVAKNSGFFILAFLFYTKSALRFISTCLLSFFFEFIFGIQLFFLLLHFFINRISVMIINKIIIVIEPPTHSSASHKLLSFLVFSFFLFQFNHLLFQVSQVDFRGNEVERLNF